MPPNIRLPKTSEEAKQLVNHSMLDYFSFPMKRGRFKPPSSKKGRKKKKKNALNEDVNSNKPSVDVVEEVQRKHFLKPIGVRKTI